MKKKLFSTKYLDLMASCREGKADWVYANRPNAKDVVVIVPILRRAEGISTIFLLTRRPPLVEEYGERLCVEFPAGLVGDENFLETTEEAIEKELLEETGYKASKIRILTRSLISSGGLTSEKSTLALADISDFKIFENPVDDGGVIVGRIEVPFNQIDDFLKENEADGNFLSAQTLAGLYYLKRENLF